MNTEQKPNIIEIDLKWSLWSEERAAFPNGVVDAIMLAWSGNGDLEIRTSPNKETRFGSVVVRNGGADVSFTYEWDEPYDLASGLDVDDLTEGEIEYAADQISEFERGMEWGVSRAVEASSVGDLLKQIDSVEKELIELESACSAEFGSFIKDLEKEIKENRERK